jgi:hypothetical protein
MRFMPILIALVFVAQGVRCIVESAEALASLNWPTSKGIVLESYVQEVHGRGTRYLPTVFYTYEVDGKPFTSGGIWIREFSGELEWARPTAARFPVGAAVKVYYDAGDVGHSLLLPEVPWDSIWGFAFCCLATLVCFRIAFWNRESPNAT